MLDLGSTQLTMLWASMVLGFVYLLAAAVTSVGQRGLSWALGPRDVPVPPINVLGGRLDRAWKNFIETFPVFAAAVLLEAMAGHGSGLGPLGALLYFWGRVAFLPLYAIGWPVVRTLAWAASLTGIVLLLIAVVPGV